MTEPSWSKGPPRRILLATDLSARCDRALDRAVALAGHWQAQLLAVHALEQTEDFYAVELNRRLPSWRRSHDAVSIAENQLRRDILQAGGQVTAIVERGEPAEVVLAAAEKHGCGLIVTGLARDETLGRFGLGGTVDRLLRRSRVPVLIVKQRVRAPYRHVLVATDFSESSRQALRAALAFFPDETLSVFHAYKAPMAGLLADPGRYREQYGNVAADDLAAFLETVEMPEERRRRLGRLVEHGNPGELIHQYVQDRGVDLVVLGTQGRNALLEVFIGSAAKEILSSLACDALVVRESEAASGSR